MTGEHIATDSQIQELSNTIALQADAIAAGKIDASALYAHVRRIADNAETLKVWTTDRQVFPETPGRRAAVESVTAVETDPGYCSGCGQFFRGSAGLRAHQSRKFISLACRPASAAFLR